MMSDARTGLFLTLKEMMRKKLGLLLIVFIVALGFINIVFFTSFTEGMGYTLQTQIITKQYGNIIIEPPEGQSYIENVGALLKKIRSVPGVISATQRYYLSALLQTENKDRTVASWYFQAINPEEEQRVTNFQDYLIGGEYLSSNDVNSIMIGSHLAGGDKQLLMPAEDTLEAKVGDWIWVVYSNSIQKKYRVKSVIDSRDFYAVMSSYITIKDAEEILGVKDKASIVLIRVPRGEELQFVKTFQEIGITENIYTWKDKAGAVNLLTGMFDTVNSVFRVIGAIIIFFTIYVVTTINIANNKKRIGTLMAIGINKRTILLSYIFTAILFGILGTLFATVLIKLIIEYMMANPVDTPMGFIHPVLSIGLYAFGLVVVFISTILGSLIPARNEMKKSIIELIWS